MRLEGSIKYIFDGAGSFGTLVGKMTGTSTIINCYDECGSKHVEKTTSSGTTTTEGDEVRSIGSAESTCSVYYGNSYDGKAYIAPAINTADGMKKKITIFIYILQCSN